MPSLRLTPPGSHISARSPRRALLIGWLLLLLILVTIAAPGPAAAAPQLILPTPPGEQWKIIQGYACGTHNAWDRYSLDLVQVDGPTYDAPIRAVAGGEFWHWEARSGTLILNHGDQFFTMYTHMARAVSTERGRYFEAGETLGFAGDRGAPGVPHLHFTAFTASRDGWSNKQSIPLRFLEGYDLPEIGGCNQHGGKVLTAMALQPPQVSFRSAAEPGRWYTGEQRIEFTTAWAGGGLSQSWDQEPPADRPMFPRAIDGYALRSEAGEGMHTLYVRVWGPDGRQTVASFGPVGYDATPPSLSATATISMSVSAGAQVVLSWPAAQDGASGVAGYKLYLGPDPQGTADWFTTEPAVKSPPLAAGTYLVRAQAIDVAGNAGPWVGLGKVVVT